MKKKKEIIPEFHLNNDSDYETFKKFIDLYGIEKAKKEFPQFRDHFGQWKLYGLYWFYARIHYGKKVDIFVEKVKTFNEKFVKEVCKRHPCSVDSEGNLGSIRKWSDGSFGYDFLKYGNILSNMTFSMENIESVSLLMYMACFPRIDIFNLEKNFKLLYLRLNKRTFDPYWKDFDREAYDREDMIATEWLENHSMEDLFIFLIGEDLTKELQEILFYDYKNDSFDINQMTLVGLTGE